MIAVMARRLRIQYPGAMYHLINRGNYRRDLFESAGAAKAFLRVLQETVATYGWRLYSYVLMRNHYHLALETSEPNLVEGMHWMQSTWATRFNRFRRENGHLFQGRYKAILLEDEYALGRVANYLHLNPVRAGIVSAAAAKTYRWSSLFAMSRGIGLQVECSSWLDALGGWNDDAEGRAAYVEYLAAVGADKGSWKEKGLVGLSKGWAIGTSGWRRALAKEYGMRSLEPGLHRDEVDNLREEVWEAVLAREMARTGRMPEDLSTRPRKQDWKVELAHRVRRECGAPLSWLARRLELGRPGSLRSYLCRRNRSDHQQTTA
jgi:putative transposase